MGRYAAQVFLFIFLRHRLFYGLNCYILEKMLLRGKGRNLSAANNSNNLANFPINAPNLLSGLSELSDFHCQTKVFAADKLRPLIRRISKGA